MYGSFIVKNKTKTKLTAAICTEFHYILIQLYLQFYILFDSNEEIQDYPD